MPPGNLYSSLKDWKLKQAVTTSARYLLFSSVVGELFDRNFPEWNDDLMDRPYDSIEVDRRGQELKACATRRLTDLVNASPAAGDEEVVRLTRRFSEVAGFRGRSGALNKHAVCSDIVRVLSLWALADTSIVGFSRPIRETRETLERIVESEKRRSLDLDLYPWDVWHEKGVAEESSREECVDFVRALLPSLHDLATGLSGMAGPSLSLP